LLVLLGSPGCYYGHLAVGQTRIMLARKSVEAILADSETEPQLRTQLVAAQGARAYAAELGLDVGGQYTGYVAWPQDRILTSVVACEPGQIEARPFRFPLIGAVPYKGFFDQERAEQEAKGLRAEGLDVCLHAIPAYSTLGFFDDPITDPMLRSGEGRLVETILHELVHATVFLKSQPDFNEGIANFIGEEASIRYYAEHADPSSAERRRAEVDDDRLLAGALLEVRARIGALYSEALPEAERLRARKALERETRASMAALPLTTRDATLLAPRLRLNDACLALQSTYEADFPRYRSTLRALDDSLPRFIARLAEAKDADDPREAFFIEPAEDPASGAP
jgi:predicted aminopeptidase